MDAAGWFKKIKKTCIDAGTYQTFFDIVIRQLSGILETKDAALELYEKSGGNPVIAHTNKGGHTNLRKNPALAVIQECDMQALAYWRDLGLTPAGLKKLNGEITVKKDASLSDVLKDLGL